MFFLPLTQAAETLQWQRFWVSSCLFFLGALLETKCDCVLASEGKLARTYSFLFGLSEAADLLEGNRCSLLLPVPSHPVSSERL